MCVSRIASDSGSSFLILSGTVLIAYKVWSVARRIRPALCNTTSGYVRVSQAATIIVESGSFKVLMLLLFMR